MDFINLESPNKRDALLPLNKIKWPVAYVSYLDRPPDLPDRNLEHLLCKRTTRREFSSLSEQSLSSLLWYTVKAIHVEQLPAGHRWLHKSIPASGGRHAIRQLIFSPDDNGWILYLYDDIAHALVRLNVATDTVSAFMRHVDSILPYENGTIVWNVAEVGKLTSVYSNSTSLFFKDEGVIQGVAAIVAEALDLAFCPLGITGEPFIGNILNLNDEIVGIGGFVIGGI